MKTEPENCLLPPDQDWYWVFHGKNSQLPSAVFSEKEKAAEWIAREELSGQLMRFPMNRSVLEFSEEDDGQITPDKSPSFANLVNQYTKEVIESCYYLDGHPCDADIFHN